MKIGEKDKLGRVWTQARADALRRNMALARRSRWPKGKQAKAHPLAAGGADLTLAITAIVRASLRAELTRLLEGL